MRLWRSPESSSPCQGEDRGIEARQARWTAHAWPILAAHVDREKRP